MDRSFLVLAALIPLIISAAPATQPPRISEKTVRLLAEWEPRFRQAHLHSLVAPPFVIAGDAGEDRLIAYRDGTILAAAHALHAMFFQTEPREPVLILLFEEDESYRRLAKEWFEEASPPHFGFYRPSDHVMLMNVATGTGTLVHELTHALMAPDFPGVPSWFNEGLASLYEQSSIGVDTIRGRVNWRLPLLQNTIRAQTLRPLQELMEDPHFYDSQRVGINYAQARYLMFYLQEKGLLQAYFRAFRANVKDDPSGYQSFEKLIGPKSVALFEQEWKAWVMTLRFEE